MDRGHPATEQRAADEAHHDQQVPKAEGGAYASSGSHEAHAGKGAGEHRPQGDAGEGTAEQKQARLAGQH